MISDVLEGMAYIGKVVDVKPIEKADKIESIEVVCGSGGKWMAVAQVGEFKVGDPCEVYLQDSILPEDERYSFMSRYNFRVRMIRLRGAPSEALVLPFGEDLVGSVGDDITELRGIKKYEKSLPITQTGHPLGSFPPFIPKTDEVNFQKVPRLVEEMLKGVFIITQKADGTSCTFYHRDGHFGVCSRRIEYKETDENLYWKLARKYNMPDILPKLGNVAVQAEGVGPGIQKNPMGLGDLEIRVFDIFDIDEQVYRDVVDVVEICEEYDWPTVKLIGIQAGATTWTSDDWRKIAEGQYDNGQEHEGVVVRPLVERTVGDYRLSFKVINLNYER